jgi:hypothetical protein
MNNKDVLSLSYDVVIDLDDLQAYFDKKSVPNDGCETISILKANNIHYLVAKYDEIVWQYLNDFGEIVPRPVDIKRKHYLEIKVYFFYNINIELLRD